MVRKFIEKLLLLLTPIIFIIISVNFFIDPAHLFSNGKYEIGIAKLLLKGKNVARITNYDERILQKLLINNFESRKRIIILGSSRANEIGSELFSDKSFFNSSVSGTSIEDFIGIYSMYREKKLIPSTIIIGLDPWLLNKNNNQTRWKSISNEYNNLTKVLIPENKDEFDFLNLIPEKYVELFSFSYFQKSLNSIINYSDFLNRNYYATNNILVIDAVKLADGSLIYDKKTREQPLEKVRSEAIAYTTRSPVYSLGSFDRLDPMNSKKLEKFVDLLQDDGVEIIFVLTPYHPYVYNYLVNSKKYKIILDVQNYYKDLAKRKNCIIIGSYDPIENSLSEKDFFDGMHPKREVFKKIFKNSNLKM